MNYLFYKLWKDFTGQVEGNSPAIYALILISAVQSINVFTVINLIINFLAISDIVLTKNNVIILSFIFNILILITNYFFVYKRKEQISEKYSAEKKFMKILGYFVLYFYIIVTFIFAYLVHKLS